jgi:hypothetical protein
VPIWTVAKNLAPTRIRSPVHPARSQSPKIIRCAFMLRKRLLYLQYERGLSPSQSQSGIVVGGQPSISSGCRASLGADDNILRGTVWRLL